MCTTLRYSVGGRLPRNALREGSSSWPKSSVPCRRSRFKAIGAEAVWGRSGPLFPTYQLVSQCFRNFRSFIVRKRLEMAGPGETELEISSGSMCFWEDLECEESMYLTRDY